MAKKRVHEIAKERGMPSKEVIATLQKAGLDVKTAAQSVDENDIEMAFSNGSKQAQPKPAQRQPQSQGGPRPLGQNPVPQQQRQAPPQGQPGQQQGEGQGQGQRPQQQRQSGGDRPQRPTRGVPPGRDGGGGGGAAPRRRVVIDSQASRRQQGPPPPQQPPRRGRGRRRRGQWVEPDFSQQEEKVEEVHITRVQSGATVKDVAESLGLSAPEIIKKLMQLGEMATLTQTLSDDAIELLASEFEKQIEIVHAGEEVDEEPEFDDAEADLVDPPPAVTI